MADNPADSGCENCPSRWRWQLINGALLRAPTARICYTASVPELTLSLDLASGLTQVLSDGTNTYIYGRGRLAQLDGDIQYYLTDALGSVRQLVDSNGNVILTKSYAPFGETMESAGTSSTSYGFTGEAMDPTGMLYLRARYYDPYTGRFISRDAWTGDASHPMSYNAWLYVYANPVNFTDPSGMITCPPGTIPSDNWECVPVSPNDNHGEPPPYPIFKTDGWEKIQPPGITFFPSSDPLYSGAHDIPWRTDQAQYKNSLGSGNLCGQVSIAAILLNLAHVDIGVEDVMKDYADLEYDNMSLSWADGLGTLIEKAYPRYLTLINKHWKWWVEAGLENNTGSWRSVNKGSDGTHQENPRKINQMMRRLFASRQYPMVSVMISKGGFIDTPYWGYSMTGHWVVLTGISNEFDYDDGQAMVYDGTTPQKFWRWRWVRVYNPFDNQTEYYPFQHFLDSWIQNDNGGILYSVKNHYQPQPTKVCENPPY